MALMSMTGFARSEGVHGVIHWFWELRSVNGRGLDLRFRLPLGYDALDPKIREIAQKKLARGNVQAALQLQHEAGMGELRINETAVEQLLHAAAKLQKKGKLPGLSMDGLLAVRGVVEVSDPALSEEEQEALREMLSRSFAEAVNGLVSARAAEGERIQLVLAAQVQQLTALIDQAVACPARQPEAIRARLAEQVERLLGASDQLDQARLYQEAMFLAAKSDIQEELDRFAAHLEAVRGLLASGVAVGRKLDFLAQEMNREANTMCAKANHASLSAIGLQIKLVVDQFREQVQNIE